MITKFCDKARLANLLFKMLLISVRVELGQSNAGNSIVIISNKTVIDTMTQCNMTSSLATLGYSMLTLNN